MRIISLIDFDKFSTSGAIVRVRFSLICDLLLAISKLLRARDLLL